MSLVGLGVVKVKMLPFDNKAEFQVQLDMPAGTPSARTSFAVGQTLARQGSCKSPTVSRRAGLLRRGRTLSHLSAWFATRFFRDAAEQTDLTSR